MTSLPEPPDHSLVWRSPTVDDAPELAAHNRRVHEAEHLDSVGGEEFMRRLMEQPGIEPHQDLLVGEADRTIVADSGTWLHRDETDARCFIWGETSPGWEHLKPFLFSWAEARARQRLGDVPSTLDRVIRTSIEEHRRGHRSVVEEAGFEAARSFAEMARPLTDLPGLPDLPPGVRVEPWSDHLGEAARIANNEAFADHWGSIAMDPEEWQGHYGESSSFRPDLSFVALAGDEVVSFCLCEVDEEDNADRLTNDLYIQRVGTVRDHRGSGLASHLIVAALGAAAATGSLDRAALDVDEMSHTDATLVYERLGFVTTGRSITYIKKV